MNGILVINKPSGITSHDVVAKLRGILHQKKIGHTGTLDPAAVGVLPVCCGKATKVCELLTDKDKSYRAVCKLGIETDTQDTTGTVLQKFDISGITEEDIIRCVSKFEGDIMQIPPMYSALRVNGKILYELAREGKTVERKARPVTISEIKVSDIDIENGTFTMDVTCSKGTYIRTLCHDIGKELGIAAAMQQLTRTRVSVFEIENAYRLSDIQKLADESIDKVQEITMQVDALFDNYRSLHIKQKYASYLANGNTLSEKMFMESDISPQINENFLIYDENNLFKAIYTKNKYEFKVAKMF